jgi:hypothetical protein
MGVGASEDEGRDAREWSRDVLPRTRRSSSRGLGEIFSSSSTTTSPRSPMAALATAPRRVFLESIILLDCPRHIRSSGTYGPPRCACAARVRQRLPRMAARARRSDLCMHHDPALHLRCAYEGVPAGPPVYCTYREARRHLAADVAARMSLSTPSRASGRDGCDVRHG